MGQLKLKVKRLSQTAVLAAAAIVIFVIEAQLPALVPVPGVKLGLANVVTLITYRMLGWREGLFVMLVRAVLGSVLAGYVTSVFFSLAGGTAAFCVMLICFDALDIANVPAVSVIAAVAHNIAQLSVAAVIFKGLAVFWYLPVLAVSGAVTGLFTGYCAKVFLKRIPSFFDTR